MPQASIKSLPRRFQMMKVDCRLKASKWGEDYRHAAADALMTILSGRMEASIDRHLAETAPRHVADRRSGFCRRHL